MSYCKISLGWSVALLCLALAATIPAQAPPQTAPGDQGAASKTVAPSSPPSEERRPNDPGYRIGPGDVLLIEVAGEPDLKKKVKVGEQGTIHLPYIDHDLKVEGLTETEVSALLRQEYLSILKEPQVTTYIEEYGARAASIMGAVNKPRRVALTRPMRLLDLLSEGGGLSEKAGTIVQLVRTKATEEAGPVASGAIEIIDTRALLRQPELNRVIQDGDVVNVPEAGVFYVGGNVQKPGQFPLKDTVKLTQAIAMAGGPLPDSKKKEILLFRSTDPTQPAKIQQVVNLTEVEKNPDKDIILQPYDIILVPEATRSKTARTILQTFVGGLANSTGYGIIR